VNSIKNKVPRLLQAAVLVAALLTAAPVLHAEPQAAAPAAASATEGTQHHHDVMQREESGEEINIYRHSPMVAKIGQAFGMSAESTARLFETINFIILASVILWFVFKSVPKLFRNRASAIQQHLADARTATEDAGLRLAGVEQRLARLDGEIAAIRAQAEQITAQDESRIKASVEEEKNKIIAAAEQEISTATATAQREIRKYAAELAIDQAARRVAINAETDRLLVQSFAGRLIGDEGKGGQN